MGPSKEITLQPSSLRKILSKVALPFGLLIIVVFVCFITWHAAMNRKGRIEWKEARDLLSAEGLAQDANGLSRPMPPETDNFAALPMFVALCEFDAVDQKIVYHNPTEQARLQRLGHGVDKHFPNWKTQELGDLAATAAAMRQHVENTDPALADQSPAEQISAVLASFEEDLDEIDRFAERPKAMLPPLDIGDCPVENMKILLPQFGPLMGHARLQACRVLAALEQDRHEEAISGLRVIDKTATSAGSQRVMLGLLVELKIRDLLLSCVWSGLVQHHWSDANLLEIQNLLMEQQIYATALKTFETEMVVMQIGGADYVAREGNGAMSRLMGGDVERTILLYNQVFPAGIWEQNKAFGCTRFVKELIRPMRSGNFSGRGRGGSYDPDAANRIVADISLRYCRKVFVDAASKGVASEQFAVACALERFRRSEGRLPKTLEKLIPDYMATIPVDPWQRSGRLQFYPEPNEKAYKIRSVRNDNMVEISLKEVGGL